MLGRVLKFGHYSNGRGENIEHSTLNVQHPTFRERGARFLGKGGVGAQEVEEGRLAPGERVQRTYTEPLGESHFFRIRLGLPVDHVYFSDEATADLTNCPTPTSTSPPPSSTSTTPPPTSSSNSGSSSSSTTSVGGHSGSSPTRGPTVKGESGSRGGTAFTGPENLPWGIAAMILLLLAGSLALRIGSRKLNADDPER